MKSNSNLALVRIVKPIGWYSSSRHVHVRHSCVFRTVEFDFWSGHTADL